MLAGLAHHLYFGRWCPQYSDRRTRRYNEDMRDDMQINYFFYMNYSGYSISAQDYLLALKHCAPETDIKVHYINEGTKSGVSSNRQQIFNAMHRQPTRPPCVNVYHSIPIRYRHRGNAKHIGFCIYETIDPPRDWIAMMNNMDGIITASQFNKNVFLSNGLKRPIEVVPHCFDPKMFHDRVKPTGRYNLTTFISIGTWKTRKNWETLIKAWYDAFEKKDHVCLLIKTDKPAELTSTVTRIKRTESWRSKDTAPIYSEESPNCTFEQIPSIMKKGDIYVSPSIGEGFNLPSFHAMALGIPVIVTRYGGTLEYAKPNLCTYFEPKEYVKHRVMDGIPQFSNKIWPKLSISEVRDKMRYVWEHKNERQEKAAAAYEYVHKNFTYDVIGKQYLGALERMT